MQVFVYEIDITPGATDEAIQEYYSTILPVLQQHDLYVESMVLLDREKNRAVYVGTYEDDPPDGKLAYHASYAKEMLDQFQHGQAQVGELRAYELLPPPPDTTPGD